jgi:ElaB/YqjD/DUF883 family membrane-anchored ribosome-binding protein
MARTSKTKATPMEAPAEDMSTLDRLRTEAASLREQATDKARSAAETGKTKASDTIDGVAQFVHDNAATLGERTTPQVTDYANRAADALDGFSQNLRTKSIDDLVGDVRSFVKRSPAVAVGAAVAIGFALTRFAKASAERTRRYRGDGRR